MADQPGGDVLQRPVNAVSGDPALLFVVPDHVRAGDRHTGPGRAESARTITTWWCRRTAIVGHRALAGELTAWMQNARP